MRRKIVSSRILVCSSKKLNIFWVLSVSIVFLLALVPKAYSAEFSASEKAFLFLKDVAMLDVTKYNVTLTGYGVQENARAWDGVYDETSLTYTLENDDSKLKAMFDFVDNNLWAFHLYVDRGAPVFSEQSFGTVLERADVFLQRYLNYTGLDCQEMKDTLANVTEPGNTTATAGNVLLEVFDYSGGIFAGTTFRWRFMFNGAEFYRCSFTFRQDGEFATLDTRLINKIGSTDVNISLEEAIDIAREFVENLTTKMGNDNPKYQNITLSNEPTWSLLVRAREPMTYYPYWIIGIGFNETILEGAAALYGVYVSIWADTGEVISSQPMVIIGLPYSEATSPTQPTEPSPPTEPESEDSTTLPLVIVLSPVNKTYTTSEIELSFTVDGQISEITYTLDGQTNVIISGNVTLVGLATGVHTLTVYAKDTAGNVGASQTIIFMVADEEELNPALEPFAILPVAAASVASVTVICAGVLIYFRKRKH
jgi:hypothetical protein